MPLRPRSTGSPGERGASRPRARRRHGPVRRGRGRGAARARRRGGHGRSRRRDRRANSRCSTASTCSSRARACPPRTRSSSRRARAASRSGARSSSATGSSPRASGSSASRARRGRRRPCACSARCWKPPAWPVALAGNEQPPLSEVAGSVEPGTWLVCELTSFQLEDVHTLALDVAVLLNLEPDHLDRHGTFEAYRDAKLRIFERAAISIVPAASGLPGSRMERRRAAAGRAADPRRAQPRERRGRDARGARAGSPRGGDRRGARRRFPASSTGSSRSRRSTASAR